MECPARKAWVGWITKMIIAPKEPERDSKRRLGIEYCLTPETEKDQDFIQCLRSVMQVIELQSTEWPSMKELAFVGSEGKYVEYFIRLYDPHNGGPVLP